MRLSLHTDYALRVLMYLTAKDRQASVDEIAVAYGISRNHLVKVARALADLNLISTRRGRGGGITLAKDAEDINVGYVVRELETLSAFVECFDPDANSCPIAGTCGLQGALAGAVEDFLARLDRYRLSDLISKPTDFRQKLDIQDVEASS